MEDEPGDALPESAPGSGKSILCFGTEMIASNGAVKARRDVRIP